MFALGVATRYHPDALAAAPQGEPGIPGSSLQNVNLNLLPVLRALLKEESVSRAAVALGRSPPAISAALSQLRAALEDPLFVRVGGRLEPTARAAGLAASLEVLCDGLEDFFTTDAFTPESSQRKFVIASSDILVHSIGPQLVQTLRANAPGMSIQFVDVGRGLTEAMVAREIDFALLPDFALDDLSPAPLKFLALQSMGPNKALMSRDHPLAKRTLLTLGELAEYPQIGFRPDPVLLEGHKPGPMDVATPVILVSQFLTVPRLLEGSDLVAFVPSRLADDAVFSRNLTVVDMVASESSRSGLAWSPVFDQDSAHKWFRSAVAKPGVEPSSARGDPEPRAPDHQPS